MRRFLFAVFVLALASVVHLDWHLARPAHHHGLSIGWNQHWLAAALGFAAVGWGVARVWPTRPWQPGAWIAALALLVAQGLEPAVEVGLYAHRLSYPDEPARWGAFFLCVATGLPVYAIALWLCRPRRRGRAGERAVVSAA